jgi:hypothetical protein
LRGGADEALVGLTSLAQQELRLPDSALPRTPAVTKDAQHLDSSSELIIVLNIHISHIHNPIDMSFKKEFTPKEVEAIPLDVTDSLLATEEPPFLSPYDTLHNNLFPPPFKA